MSQSNRSTTTDNICLLQMNNWNACHHGVCHCAGDLAANRHFRVDIYSLPQSFSLSCRSRAMGTVNTPDRIFLMGTRTLAVFVTIAFSVIGVLGDYFLKLASAREQPLRTSWFYVGFALYASTAFGWVFVMGRLRLATISVLYSVSLMLLLTAVGVVLFQESLNYYEVIGRSEER